MKSGELVNVSLTISPMTDTVGRIVGASKIGRDISERKRAEEERQNLLAKENAARTEAERANRLQEGRWKPFVPRQNPRRSLSKALLIVRWLLSGETQNA
jgi:hypothetical protein